MALLSLNPELVKPGRPWLRTLAFVLSLSLHLVFAGSAMWFDLLVQWREESINRSRYQVLMLPKPQVIRHKTLYYDFRKPVPEVAPVRPFGAAKIPQGQRDEASRTLIADSPKPASRRQFIWQPKHPEPIAADIPSPNLAEPAPAVPALAKPQRRVFMPPPEARPKATPSLVAEPPPPPVPGALANFRDERLLQDLARHDLEVARKPPRKQFVAPAAQAKPASGTAMWVEPPQAPAQAGNGGVAQTVIVGLDPADRLSAPIPEGSRSAQFARAAAVGAPSSGSSTSPDTLRAPGIAAHSSPGLSVGVAGSRPANAVPERRTLTEIVFPSVNRTMSAPLRPSSRIVPAAVEAKFANRDVYALVVPGPKLAGYAGDWVLWFAPRDAGNGAGLRIQAPVPARKEVWSGDNEREPEATGKGSVQFQAIIDSRGRVLSPQILRGLASEPFRRRASAELLSWEFKPSLRNGEAVDVDVVLEIPFEFRPPVAQAR